MKTANANANEENCHSRRATSGWRKYFRYEPPSSSRRRRPAGGGATWIRSGSGAGEICGSKKYVERMLANESAVARRIGYVKPECERNLEITGPMRTTR